MSLSEGGTGDGEHLGYALAEERYDSISDKYAVVTFSPRRSRHRGHCGAFTPAYAWLADGRLFNLVMIEGGFAREYSYDRAYKYQREFRLAQASAQRAHLGLWAACANTA